MLDHISGHLPLNDHRAAGRDDCHELTPQPVSRWVARSGGPPGSHHPHPRRPARPDVGGGYLFRAVRVPHHQCHRRGAGAPRHRIAEALLHQTDVPLVSCAVRLPVSSADLGPSFRTTNPGFSRHVPPSGWGSDRIPSICGIRSSASSSSINSTSVMGLGCLWWCCCSPSLSQTFRTGMLSRHYATSDDVCPSNSVSRVLPARFHSRSWARSRDDAHGSPTSVRLWPRRSRPSRRADANRLLHQPRDDLSAPLGSANHRRTPRFQSPVVRCRRTLPCGCRVEVSRDRDGGEAACEARSTIHWHGPMLLEMQRIKAEIGGISPARSGWCHGLRSLSTTGKPQP